MRQVGTLSHENHARRLVNYLTAQGIGSKCEVSFEPLHGQMSYQIWILEEDKIEMAAAMFAEFEKNPSDSKFDAPEPEPETLATPDLEDTPVHVHHFKTSLTYFIIFICSLVFFLSVVQSAAQKKEMGKEKAAKTLTQIQSDLMYDVPPLEGSPYWQGLYGYVVAKFKNEPTKTVEGPLFEKIREGEVWRLFTPCILHFDLLHILFNMLWLWYLGRPMEQRMGPVRFLVFTLVAGVLGNTLQYLMSGPLFIGYSGVVTAMAGFIWMREKIAPWEGYPLTRGTIFFLLFFILAILALQVVAFFIDVFTTHSFTPNIANTAHIAGAVIGAILGRLRFFAQRVKP